MKDPRLAKLADLIVNYSTKVKPGDFVFVSCEDLCAPWMAEIVQAALKAGAHVETELYNNEVAEIKLRHSSPEQLQQANFMREFMLTKADVWLTAWGTTNTRSNSNIEADRLKLSTIGATSWRKIYSERMHNGSLRWCGTQFPTQSNAQDANMSLTEYEDFVYGAGYFDKADPVAEWKKMSEQNERWIKYLNTKKEIHIISEGTDIKANVAGRPWVNCDGKVNFPDGEIFTAPIEDGINGFINFSFPGIYAGKEIEGIRLEVKQGLVVKATAKKGEELLHALLETDAGAKRFGELAIGTNYGIQKFTRNMLFDEKIGGTVHMAIGDSAGDSGKNKSAIHWDMLCDMRTGGQIFADGQLFYENGQFINSVL